MHHDRLSVLKNKLEERNVRVNPLCFANNTGIRHPISKE
jgi:hypothetical protein